MLSFIPPGFLEIWNMWIGLAPGIPFWDPFGALFTLISVGIIATFQIMRFISG